MKFLLMLVFCFVSFSVNAVTWTKGKECYKEYVYDFSSVVAASTGGTYAVPYTYTLGSFPVGTILKEVSAKVVTPLAGSGAFVTWGTDLHYGFSGLTASGVASYATANTIVNGAGLGSSLLWDDSNDHYIYPTTNVAASSIFTFTISGAPLTAGKMLFMLECISPSK